MPSVKLTLEYEGGDFSGWAAQPGLRTVEGELGNALATVLRVEVKLSVAGRTDAGVHAWRQVASFAVEDIAVELPQLVGATNALLPPDVSVLGAEAVDDGFDARRDAVSRTYCYRVVPGAVRRPLERGRALWWPHQMDEQRLEECAAVLTGLHDFTAFTPVRSEHVRFEREVIRAEWCRRGEVLEFWIEADMFMRHMVRILVGTMLEVSGGRRTVERFIELLHGAPRPEAGATQEPHGLYLASVLYGTVPERSRVLTNMSTSMGRSAPKA